MSRNEVAFQRVPFYVAVGVSLYGKQRCGIMVNHGEPGDCIVKPTYGLKHKFTYYFTFNACRKVPFSAILGNLVANGIVPVDEKGFNPPYNPDNSFYLRLPVEKMEQIKEIIRATLNGITIGANCTPEFSEYELSPEAVEMSLAKDKNPCPGGGVYCLVANGDNVEYHVEHAPTAATRVMQL
ncbi:hypothetical protein PV-S19_0251 [Pacmanvirus S19]|nr:hypothetical protein PV-S19_0251 [Pacmanvirus S19]